MEGLKKVKIANIIAIEHEYRFFDVVNFERLKYSLRKYGQLRPVYCHEHFDQDGSKLYCHEGRKILKAMKELGMEEVHIIALEDEEAIRHLHLTMNEFGFWRCDVDLAICLSAIEKKDYQILPFNEEQVKSFEDLLNFDWKTFAERRAPEKVQPGLFDIFEETEGEVSDTEKAEMESIGNEVLEEEYKKMEESPLEYPLSKPPPGISLPPLKVPVMESDTEITKKIETPTEKKPEILHVYVKVIGGMSRREIPLVREVDYKNKFGEEMPTEEQYNEFIAEITEPENPNQLNLI